MAILEHASKELVFLTQDSLVGRSERCTIRVRDEHVSRVHALLWWDERDWIVKDLGSDNGTFVDGTRLERGAGAPLAIGTELVIGHREVAYRVVDIDPPVRATQVALAREDVVAADVTACGGLLALPPPGARDEVGASTLTLFRDMDGRWVMEGHARALQDGDVVEAGGRAYRISLPRPSMRTKPLDGFVGHSVAELGLTLVPSCDFDQIELRVAILGERESRSLGAHRHNDLLLALADHRVKNGDGWIDDGELVKRAGFESRERLNTEVYRARKQFATLGLCNPAQIIERRLQSKKTRLGVVREVTIARA